MKVKQALVWIDCEMTGLDHAKDRIIEICAIVTDAKLNRVGDTFHRVVNQPKPLLDSMDEWCTRTHGESGLTARVLSSTHRPADVQRDLLQFLQRYTERGDALLAGNSVHMDRLFLLREYPQVVDYLHYRLLDVSSIFETARRLCPERLAGKPAKRKAHTAEADILESLDELRFYQQRFFFNTDTYDD